MMEPHFSKTKSKVCCIIFTGVFFNQASNFLMVMFMFLLKVSFLNYSYLKSFPLKLNLTVNFEHHCS